MSTAPTNMFIASSVEGLEVAESVKALLEHSSIRAEIWTQGTFKANGYPLEQLELALQKHRFGLFIMTPDDILLRRNEEVNVARDNVLLELGMFIGKYGREHCFIMLPRGGAAPKMPSDLTGFNTLDYDHEWFKDSPDAALGTSVRAIKIKIDSDKSKMELIKEDVFVGHEAQNEILKILFNLSKETKSEQVKEYLSLGNGDFQYHIDELLRKNYISSCDRKSLMITEVGRKYVFESL
ncbi:TIR domain-containing protein [Vibrio jasicida]|uniref:TIR domain-containing protein n=1 Tax=Vibrio jasicida TaxID=766224 RepID=UPI0006938DF8|nr:nucleotide-binding protein [Vibrio jasicida]